MARRQYASYTMCCQLSFAWPMFMKIHLPTRKYFLLNSKLMHNSLPFQLLFKHQKQQKYKNIKNKPKMPNFVFIHANFIRAQSWFHFIVEQKLKNSREKWKIRDGNSRKYLPTQIIMFFGCFQRKSRNMKYISNDDKILLVESLIILSKGIKSKLEFQWEHFMQKSPRSDRKLFLEQTNPR